jgi:hypothetical protein
MDTRELLRMIPDLPRRQDSTEAQLRDLWAVANKLGLYDAADAIKPLANLK